MQPRRLDFKQLNKSSCISRLPSRNVGEELPQAVENDSGDSLMTAAAVEINPPIFRTSTASWNDLREKNSLFLCHISPFNENAVISQWCFFIDISQISLQVCRKV